MAITTKQLANLKPKNKRYRISDANGLYVEVMTSGSIFWRYAYRFEGKQHVLTLGEYPLLTLKAARELHNEARVKLARGENPKGDTQTVAQKTTFRDVGMRFVQLNLDRWSDKHRIRTQGYLTNRINPAIGDRPIDSLTAKDLLPIFHEIEADKLKDTAGRVKSLLSQIFRLGIISGYCAHDPARDLTGAIKPSETGNFAAITEPEPFAHLINAIDHYPIEGIAKFALQLQPRVFLRPTELRNMRWEWIDFENKLVLFPAEIMKMRRDHVLPLSRQAMAIIQKVLDSFGDDSEYVFRSVKTKDRPISDGTMNSALKVLGYGGDRQTPHGFRACARTLLDEELGYRVDYIEHQLAHAVKDPTGRAYNRTSFLPQRVEMMQAWADYLDELAGKARRGERILRRLGFNS